MVFFRRHISVSTSPLDARAKFCFNEEKVDRTRRVAGKALTRSGGVRLSLRGWKEEVKRVFFNFAHHSKTHGLTQRWCGGTWTEKYSAHCRMVVGWDWDDSMSFRVNCVWRSQKKRSKKKSAQPRPTGQRNADHHRWRRRFEYLEDGYHCEAVFGSMSFYPEDFLFECHGSFQWYRSLRKDMTRAYELSSRECGFPRNHSFLMNKWCAG